MSIEEYLLDTGKSLENEMTEFEKKCYGMTKTRIRKEYMDSLTAKFSGNEMVVMGILSDCQEMLVANDPWIPAVSPRNENIRKQLNIAKFILSEMMDQKVTQ